MDLKLPCCATGCPCKHFVAATKLRVCDGCSHSWLTHLFEKLLRSDEALSILDVCSLALYGTQALPIRLKIVIERLMSTLEPEEVDNILQSFGWTPLDLARGYMITDLDGTHLTRWSILSRDEEPLILEQFLRFTPTHSLTFALLRKDLPVPVSRENEIQSSNHHSHHHHQHQHHHIIEQQQQTQQQQQQCTPMTMMTTNNKSPSPIDEHDSSAALNLSTGPSSLSTSESSTSDDDDTSLHAVDLSSKSDTSGIPTDQNIEPRTSPSPNIKKHWGSPKGFVNPTTGKRRVVCSICEKSFCDKGALKIHFSAVHLREMHKCTVSGCTMMFSSRRSRNRHSANPNPKLHSPHTRRKISPHDGRTCQPLLSSFPPMLGNFGRIKDEIIVESKPDESLPPCGLDLLIRKNGARKRKLSNPIRLPAQSSDSCTGVLESKRNYMGSSGGGRAPESDSDFSDHHHYNNHIPKCNSPSRQSESNISSPGSSSNNPLRSLATRVFHFNSNFQNMNLNTMTERWCESIFTKQKLDFLFDKSSLLDEERIKRASV